MCGNLWTEDTEAIRRIALWSGCTRTRAVMSQALSCWLMENANVSKPKHWTRLPRWIWCSGDVQVVVGTNWDHLEAETTEKASKKATLGLVILRHDSSLGLTPYVIFWSFPGVFFLESRPSWLKIIVPNRKKTTDSSGMFQYSNGVFSFWSSQNDKVPTFSAMKSGSENVWGFLCGGLSGSKPFSRDHAAEPFPSAWHHQPRSAGWPRFG